MLVERDSREAQASSVSLKFYFGFNKTSASQLRKLSGLKIVTTFPGQERPRSWRDPNKPGMTVRRKSSAVLEKREQIK